MCVCVCVCVCEEREREREGKPSVLFMCVRALCVRARARVCMYVCCR